MMLRHSLHKRLHSSSAYSGGDPRDLLQVSPDGGGKEEPSAWLRVIAHLELVTSDERWGLTKGGVRIATAKRLGAVQQSVGTGRPHHITSRNKNGIGLDRAFTVEERQDEKTVVLSWHGATTGRVTGQRWTLTRAKRRNRCAMSAKLIESGDLIFRPARSNPDSRNNENVILASVIDGVSPVFSEEDV
jgi:hypothetical protein